MVLTHAVYGGCFVKSFPADGAEFSLVVRRLGPTVCHRVFDDAWCDAGARSDHIADASFVHDEIAH